MTRVSFSSEIKPGDLDAAYAFLRKRCRGRADILEALGATMFSVMYAFSEGMVVSGIPASEVSNVIEQFRAQVIAQLPREVTRG